MRKARLVIVVLLSSNLSGSSGTLAFAERAMPSAHTVSNEPFSVEALTLRSSVTPGLLERHVTARCWRWTRQVINHIPVSHQLSMSFGPPVWGSPSNETLSERLDQIALMGLRAMFSEGDAIRAERLVIRLLLELRLLPHPSKGYVLSLLSGADLFPFEYISGVGIDIRPATADRYFIRSVVAAAQKVGVVMDEATVAAHYKGTLNLDIEDTDEIARRLLGLFQNRPEVIFCKNVEKYFVVYFAGRLKRSDPASVEMIKQRYREVFERLIATLSPRRVILWDHDGPVESSQQALEANGYRDVLPERLTPGQLDKLKRFDGSSQMFFIYHMGQNFVVRFGGHLRVFERPVSPPANRLAAQA